MKFIPLGGYRPDNPGIRLMSETNDIEVWLVPLSGTAMYVPYRIVLPTLVGYGSALATSFQVEGAEPRQSRSLAAVLGRFAFEGWVLFGASAAPEVNAEGSNPNM